MTERAPPTNDGIVSESRTASGSLLNGISSIISTGLGFLLVVIVTRSYGAENTGVFFGVIALFAIVATAAKLGTETALVFLIARYRASVQAGSPLKIQVLLDQGAMSSVRDVDGERRVPVMDYDEHFQRFADEPDPRPYLERLWEPVVLIDGDIAMVWARYDFWLGEVFSHGGTDVVVLLRTDAGWKIASFAWSVETEATDTPLGPPDFDDEHSDGEDDDD